MNSWSKASAYMGLAFVIPVAMYACWWIGDWADQKYGTKWFGLVGLLVGFAAGLYELLKQSSRIEGGPKS